MPRIDANQAQAAQHEPRYWRGYERVPGQMVVIYDDPDAADDLAEQLGTWAKHSKLRGNDTFTDFSVVGLRTAP